jgi:FkbM family methyltransferase
MLSNVRALVRQHRRESARRYLHDAAPLHLRSRPQLVCYSFDGIGIDLNVDGRCDAVSLELLLKVVDVAGRNVLDVGANIGNHASAFAERAAHVFAFEPHPKTYQLLKLNLSEFDNTTTFNLGASDAEATVQAVSPRLNFGATAISDRPAGAGESIWSFRVAPLDSIPQLTNIALFKLDVEGHEVQALKGAAALLRREKPVVVLEQNSDAIRDGTSEAIDFLRSLGFSHLYSLEADIPWRTPQALPGPIRKACRIAESVIFGPSDWTARIYPLDRLQKRDYPMLIASTHPLSLT